jgi:WD40 repeat protein
MKWFAIGWLSLLLYPVSLSAAEAPIVAIAIAPDGETVLTGSNRGVAVHVHLTFHDSFEIEFSNVHDLEFSPDGRRLAVAGGDPGETGIVQIFSWPDKKPVQRLEHHTDVVFDVAWNSDGRQLVSGGLDKRVLLWNVADGSVEREFAGHSKGVTSVCLIEDRRLLVSAGIDQSLRVWDTRTGKLVRTLDNHTAAVNDLARRPSAGGLPMVVSCGNDRTLRFWQPSIGRLVRFARLDAIPLAAVWLPGQPLVAVSMTDGTILIIDAETTETVHKFQVDDERLYSLAISKDGTTLFAGNRRGQLERIAVPTE